jgi:Trypsin-like peptidase domain
MPSLPAIRRAPALFALAVTGALVLTVSPAFAGTTPTMTLARPVAPAAARPDVAVAAVPADLTATIRLSNCSASLVRYPTSQSSDRAMMLTNGHCFEGGFIPAGQVITNRSSRRTGTLLRSNGSSALRLTADRVLYATMTGTDVTLYRLTRSFSSIQSATGIRPRTITASHPSPSDTFVPSGFFARVFNCDIERFVQTLREDQWTWHDSIRYARGCDTIHGTSGSPVVSVATGEVVGINNTGNDDGERCTLNNPCEVNPDGTIFAQQGLNYGQQVFWFNTCLTSSRTIDLNRSGCLLTKPGGRG